MSCLYKRTSGITTASTVALMAAHQTGALAKIEMVATSALGKAVPKIERKTGKNKKSTNAPMAQATTPSIRPSNNSHCVISFLL